VDLEEVWRIREEEIYPNLFKGEERGIFTLNAALFTERFGSKAIDPKWLTYGVLEFGPTAERPFWLYVTSAHSNPWEQTPESYDPAGISGAGVEFLFASTEQADWAIRFLQNMLAFDILLCADFFQGRPPLGEFDRIPLRAPINGMDNSLIRNAVVSRPEELPSGFVLPSGRVEFLAFTGTTDEEIAFAKQNGTDALVDLLHAVGHHPVTDPDRRSIL
jgi:hypothetical protein